MVGHKLKLSCLSLKPTHTRTPHTRMQATGFELIDQCKLIDNHGLILPQVCVCVCGCGCVCALLARVCVVCACIRILEQVTSEGGWHTTCVVGPQVMGLAAVSVRIHKRWAKSDDSRCRVLLPLDARVRGGSGSHCL